MAVAVQVLAGARAGDLAEPYPGLTPEDRVLGYVAWQLVGDWQRWVRRRVESIAYETATAIRRRVSVDLRMIPEVFGKPVVAQGEERIHYVPIALLRKERLVRFDLRDEQDRALPLITRHRNSLIAAAMLCAAAQSVIAAQLGRLRSDIAIAQPSVIELPDAVELFFWRLAYRNAGGREPHGDTGAALVGDGGAVPLLFDRIDSAEIARATPLEHWEWKITAAGMKADAQVADWYAALLSDPSFVGLAFDVARLFMVCVPLPYSPNERRIVKFGYTEYLGEPEGPVHESVKTAIVKLGIARAWNRVEDYLEGIPRAVPATAEEWVPSLGASQPPRMRLRRKICEAIGWTTKIVRFETPAVCHGSSYHINVSTPNGIQIRRAQLAIVAGGSGGGGDGSGGGGGSNSGGSSGDGSSSRAGDGGGGGGGGGGPIKTVPTPPQRGNRTLRSVDLHVANVRAVRSANTYVNIRPESSLIVRGGFICSALTATALTLLWIFSDRVTSGSGVHTDSGAAVLIVIPGLLAVLAARDSEHPLATHMAFGIRVLAMAPGLLAILAAGQLIAGDPDSWFGILLFALAWAIALTLGVAWRLCARGRPDRRAL